ncbi:MAG: M18 family aminopeptidase [Oscillospiraceae bacterium]|nr:M18 family aminopeptidase [Oscillospiraceae bacterium]
MQEESVQSLVRFLSRSPSAFHAVSALKEELEAAGFKQLKESGPWQLEPGGKYYVIRNGSSILSFMLPESRFSGFHIIASHSDSPSYKIKPGPALVSDGRLIRLNVEKYGSSIDSSWFDRPLSIAGRIVIEEESGLREILVNPDRDLLMIPSLATHLRRGEPAGKTIEIQNEMLPILGSGSDPQLLIKILAQEAAVRPDQIISWDLYLCCRETPRIWGANREFIAAPRLDDLQCCYASFQGFLNSCPQDSVPVHCVFDNEEVGSKTRQGADSSFLRTVLERICYGSGLEQEAFRMLIHDSFLVSADNAHALHPNYPRYYDPENRVHLNGGIVLKYQAGQRYATDAVSAAVVKKICRDQGIPCQEFTNHSDIAGGGTLGNISVSQIPLPTADIGLPQLAMHSCFETAGVHDTEALIRFSKAFYSNPLPIVKHLSE